MNQAIEKSNNRTRKILILFVVVFLLFALTSCGGFEDPLAKGEFKWHEYILVYPIGWFMATISALFGNNYGMGILITTIVIRTLSWPIHSRSSEMSLKMSLMQPEMQRIQGKYANREDKESQQRMQMEQAQLMQKYKISPLGCLLPILQMPIFLSVYQVVRRIYLPGGIWAEHVSNMNFIGIDLTSRATAGDWRGWVLSILVAALNLVMVLIAAKPPSYQKNTHKHSSAGQEDQPGQGSMKVMQYVMIAMMFSFAITSNSIALYWLVGNMISIIQTLITRKMNEKKYYEMKNADLVVKSRE